MPTADLLAPGSLDGRTGGYVYDRRIAEGLRRLGWKVVFTQLDGSFPHPTPAALAHAAHTLASISDGGVVVVDGLAFGAMPELIQQEARRLRFVALVHLPLAADVGLDHDEAVRLEVAERQALAAASLVVVTGTATLPILERYGLPTDHVVVIEPGTDPAPLARGSGSDRLHMVCVATLNPGKGHEILLRALAALPQRTWRLTCAGSATRHPATADRVARVIRAERLERIVTVAGELGPQELADLYDGADVFVLATLQETYGMAVAEALARGLPVVGTTTGALPDLVGDFAGLLVPPADVDALSDALDRMLSDAALRERMAEGARRVRQQLPTWEHAASKMADALARVVER